MSSGNSFNFGEINQHASGGSVNQVGQNTATVSNAPVNAPSIEDVFTNVTKSIEQSLPPEDAHELTVSALQPLEDMAELPADQQQTDDVQERAESIYARLVPYGPQIVKGLAAFGEAALTAVASSNPIVAGLLAVCKTAGGEA